MLFSSRFGVSSSVTYLYVSLGVTRRASKRNRVAKTITSTKSAYEIAAAYPKLPKVKAVSKIYMVSDSVAEPGPPPVVTTITMASWISMWQT